MLGDSITDAAEWHELIPGISIVNRGIGGDTTYGLLDRMETVFSLKPKKLFIMIGINDLKWGLDSKTSFENYKKILTIIEKKAIPVTVFSVIYPGRAHQAKYLRRFKGDLVERVKKFNQDLSAYCEQIGVEYRDLNSKLTKNGLLKEEFTFDGLHLNGKAYAIWVEMIKKDL